MILKTVDTSFHAISSIFFSIQKISFILFIYFFIHSILPKRRKRNVKIGRTTLIDCHFTFSEQNRISIVHVRNSSEKS